LRDPLDQAEATCLVLAIRTKHVVAVTCSQNNDTLYCLESIAVIRIPATPPSLARPALTWQVLSLDPYSCAKVACGDSALIDGFGLGLIAPRPAPPRCISGWLGLAHLASKACAAPEGISTRAIEEYKINLAVVNCKLESCNHGQGMD
jgi:hypothetical protein